MVDILNPQDELELQSDRTIPTFDTSGVSSTVDTPPVLPQTDSVIPTPTEEPTPIAQSQGTLPLGQPIPQKEEVVGQGTVLPTEEAFQPPDIPQIQPLTPPVSNTENINQAVTIETILDKLPSRDIPPEILPNLNTILGINANQLFVPERKVDSIDTSRQTTLDELNELRKKNAYLVAPNEVGISPYQQYNPDGSRIVTVPGVDNSIASEGLSSITGKELQDTLDPNREENTVGKILGFIGNAVNYVAKSATFPFRAPVFGSNEQYKEFLREERDINLLNKLTEGSQVDPNKAGINKFGVRFDPKSGVFGDYGSLGGISGALYAVNLPQNILVGGIRELADPLVSYVTGEEYGLRGSKIIAALQGRDLGFFSPWSRENYYSLVEPEELEGGVLASGNANIDAPELFKQYWDVPERLSSTQASDDTLSRIARFASFTGTSDPDRKQAIPRWLGELAFHTAPAFLAELATGGIADIGVSNIVTVIARQSKKLLAVPDLAPSVAKFASNAPTKTPYLPIELTEDLWITPTTLTKPPEVYKPPTPNKVTAALPEAPPIPRPYTLARPDYLRRVQRFNDLEVDKSVLDVLGKVDDPSSTIPGLTKKVTPTPTEAQLDVLSDAVPTLKRYTYGLQEPFKIETGGSIVPYQGKVDDLVDAYKVSETKLLDIGDAFVDGNPRRITNTTRDYIQENLITKFKEAGTPPTQVYEAKVVSKVYPVEMRGVTDDIVESGGALVLYDRNIERLGRDIQELTEALEDAAVYKKEVEVVLDILDDVNPGSINDSINTRAYAGLVDEDIPRPNRNTSKFSKLIEDLEDVQQKDIKVSSEIYGRTTELIDKRRAVEGLEPAQVVDDVDLPTLDTSDVGKKKLGDLLKDLEANEELDNVNTAEVLNIAQESIDDLEGGLRARPTRRALSGTTDEIVEEVPTRQLAEGVDDAPPQSIQELNRQRRATQEPTGGVQGRITPEEVEQSRVLDDTPSTSNNRGEIQRLNKERRATQESIEDVQSRITKGQEVQATVLDDTPRQPTPKRAEELFDSSVTKEISVNFSQEEVLSLANRMRGLRKTPEFNHVVGVLNEGKISSVAELERIISYKGQSNKFDEVIDGIQRKFFPALETPAQAYLIRKYPEVLNGIVSPQYLSSTKLNKNTSHLFETSKQTIPTNYYYHGSSRTFDINSVDLAKGSGTNELGIGLYFYENERFAEVAANARHGQHVPELLLTESPKPLVYSVNIEALIGNKLNGDLASTSQINKVFSKSIEEVFGKVSANAFLDDVKKSHPKIFELWEKTRSVINETALSKVSEGNVRAVFNRIRYKLIDDYGIDALVVPNHSLVVLDNTNLKLLGITEAPLQEGFDAAKRNSINVGARFKQLDSVKAVIKQAEADAVNKFLDDAAQELITARKQQAVDIIDMVDVETELIDKVSKNNNISFEQAGELMKKRIKDDYKIDFDVPDNPCL